MSGDFKDKVVVVTGAGRGLGKDIAQAFASQGAKIMIAARTMSYGDQTVKEMREGGMTVGLCQVDVTVRTDIEKLIKETVKLYGQIDVVVHSAAECSVAPILELADAEVDSVLTSGIKASIWLIQSAHPFLKSARDGGRVVLLSSICGPRTAIPGLAHYAAAKAGINAIIANAAIELAKDRITVNGIEPGVTGTDRFMEWTPPDQRDVPAKSVPIGRIAKPSEIARGVLFLAHGDSGYITGETIVIDGGLTLNSSGR